MQIILRKYLQPFQGLYVFILIMLLMCILSEDYISYFSNVSSELIMFAFGEFWLLLTGKGGGGGEGVEEGELLCFQKHIKVALFLKSAEVYLNS